MELMKGSLNTFLNAFTYPDRTCYPVASCNLQVCTLRCFWQPLTYRLFSPAATVAFRSISSTYDQNLLAASLCMRSAQCAHIAEGLRCKDWLAP